MIYDSWISDVMHTFDKVKHNEGIHSAIVDGKEIFVFPNVFDFTYFHDSIWFAREITKIVGKQSFLEIGTGTGIITLFAALNGASVAVTDINPDALTNAAYNFGKYGLEARYYFGNVYEPLPSKEKYDFIFWNHPFAYGSDPSVDLLLQSVFDYHYTGLERYISGGQQHLKPNGRLLLGSSKYASQSEIERIASSYGYGIEILKEEKYPWESVDLYLRILELVK